MAHRVTIRVLFFGMLKDVAGVAETTADLPEGAQAGDVFEYFAARHPDLNKHSHSTVMALNQRYAARTDRVQDGDEIAFLPPVSGGGSPYIDIVEDEAGHFFALTREPIDAAELKRRTVQPSDGALVVFEGVVRNHSGGRRTLFLDYECYQAMAIRVLADMGRRVAARHGLSRIAVVHRLGRLAIGETSVVIMASAGHRQAAFDAAMEAINRLKKEVPIWKKEHFEDGAVWVEGEWDSSIAGA